MEIQAQTQASAGSVPGRGARPRQRATLPIVGLTSGRGAVAVERALQEVPGVIRAYANPATEMAYVEYDPQRTGLAAFTKAIESAGFRNGEAIPSEARSDASEVPKTKRGGDES